MVAEQNSLRIYDSKRTFFARLGETFNKLFEPTKMGINNFILSSKRNNVLKLYKQVENINDDKKQFVEKNLNSAYSIYLDNIDDLLINSIYKKVRANTASNFEKEAIGKYYNIVHLKDEDAEEFKLKKEQYLLGLDFNNVQNSNKTKLIEAYTKFYLEKMELLYKKLLKRYSARITEKRINENQAEIYEKIYLTIDEYAKKIIPLKTTLDKEVTKLYSLYETYEVGKLDQVDVLDKKMILISLSRKLFTHSLPLVIAEKLYINILKDVRNLMVDTKILRKRNNAYQLYLKMIEQYNDSLLAVKMYWRDNQEKQEHTNFSNKRQFLIQNKDIYGTKEYNRLKEILYIKSDVKFLERYGNKYYRILQFFYSKLNELGYKRLKNSVKEIGRVKFIRK